MSLRYLKHFFTVSLLLCAFMALGQTGTVRGFIYDDLTGDPIKYTTVMVKNKADGSVFGNPTDNNGYYSITQIPPGEYILTVSNIAYKTVEIALSIKANDIISENIDLEEDAEVLDGVVIDAEYQNKVDNVGASVVKVDIKDIERIPSIGGEPDIVNVLMTRPGVVTTGDQGGQLYVRGGSPIQNMVLLDGMVIYNPFHSIGFYSVFDTDIIRAAEIYTGGYGSQYGGRISSVMDITTKDGNKNYLSGKISVTPFGAKTLLEGPIKKAKNDNDGTISFIASAKHSYLEQTSQQLYTYVDSAGLPFNYTDLYGKISFSGKSGSSFNLFGFNFSDRVNNYQAISDFNWNSFGVGSNFVMVPRGTPVLIEGKVAFSDYQIQLTEDTLAARSSRINGFNVGFDFKYFLGEDHIKYGVEMLGYRTEFYFFNQNNRKIEQEVNSTDIAGYITYKKKAGLWVIEPGFRAHYYASLKQLSAEPRLGVKFNAFEKLRFKLAAGLYSQNLISANSDRDVVNLFYGFLSGPDNLQDSLLQTDGTERAVNHALQKATHLIVGFELDVNKKLDLNVEGYLKNFGQLTNMNRNKIYDDSPDNYDKPDILKKDFIVETGYSYGVDVELKYTGEKLYLSGVYSYGKVIRWDGFQEYAPIFDRRHTVNLMASYQWGEEKEWEVNARWNFGSGLPFTQTAGYYELVDFSSQGIGTQYQHTNANLGIVFSDLNQGRLSSYHRLDITVKRKFEIKQKTRGEDQDRVRRKPQVIEITAGVTNAYNRNNVFYFDRVRFERVDQLPILPSVGFSWRF